MLTKPESDSINSLAKISFSLAPADIPNKTFMKDEYFVLPAGLVFVDKKLPQKFKAPADHYHKNVIVKSSTKYPLLYTAPPYLG